MFQRWLVAFLADRGWRYLQQRRARQQLGRTIGKRARKQAQQADRKRARGGFKPGRALTVLALGAGAYAYYRSRQQSAWNDQFSTPPARLSNPTGLTASAAATAATPSTASVTEPETAAPAYNATSAQTPPTSGDTAMLSEADHDPLAPEADAPTYTTQSSPASDTLAVPAANPEDDVAEAVAPTYSAQTTPAEATLAVPAVAQDNDNAGAADADALNAKAASHTGDAPAVNQAPPQEAPDDQRI